MGTVEPIESKMSICGDPIHPMLVHFPLTAVLGLIVTDGFYIYTGDFFWARAGLWLAGVGAAWGWLAGLVGLVDLVSVRDIRRLITGWSHAIFAVMMLSLLSYNWLLRIQDAAAMILPWGLYVSLLSGALVLITALLGGRLVYEHAVGISAD